MKQRVALAQTFHDEDWFGGKNYFASLLHALELLKPGDFEFVLITGLETRTTLPKEFPRLEVIRTAYLDRYHPLWWARQPTIHAFDRDPLFARFLRARSIDVLSHSMQLGPSPGVKTIEWLYDFQFMHFPEYWQAKHIRRVGRRYRAACRNCDALIVSSQHALGDLRRFAPWCRTPGHVLHFVSNPPQESALLAAESVRKRHGLSGDFFYLPNQFWANKNHRLVIDALQVLRARGVYATVACTGKTVDGRQPKYVEGLLGYATSLKLADQFRVLGVVPYSDTQGLMASCRAVINPSLFEGWSTTVEEAKTMRKRLLLSDIPVHREQSPDLGRFFSPNDSEALADLMQRSLAEPPRLVSAAEIASDYRQRLERFGMEYLAILRSVAQPVPRC